MVYKTSKNMKHPTVSVIHDGPYVMPFTHTLPCDKPYIFPLNLIHEHVCVKTLQIPLKVHLRKFHRGACL